MKDLNKLTSLSLGSPAVTSAGVKELQAALPKRKFEGAPDPNADIPPPDAAEARAAVAIMKLGGRVTRDYKRPGQPVIEVNLWGTQVTDTGLKQLADLKQLTTLHLGETRVTDAGLAELAELKQLTLLRLTDCVQVTDAGLKELAHHKWAAPRNLVQRI